PYAYANRSTSSFFVATVLYVLWPWLSMAALLVFQASMRQAKIQNHHVLRAVLYTGDASWLMVGTAIIVVPSFILHTPMKVLGTGVATQIGWVILFALFTTWRLHSAYRYYLRFDRPLFTVIAAQTIVLLSAIVVIVNWTPGRW
ncbi:MAG: hypothetical protein H0T11_07500, partial [Chthoniobacterales bacterium]|nr:hypothetical protein [Chthoniobacterales bacterium]